MVLAVAVTATPSKISLKGVVAIYKLSKDVELIDGGS